MTGRVATATIMFTDLVGFTEYTDACGDTAAVAVLDEHPATVSDDEQRRAMLDALGRAASEYRASVAAGFDPAPYTTPAPANESLGAVSLEVVRRMNALAVERGLEQ